LKTKNSHDKESLETPCFGARCKIAMRDGHGEGESLICCRREVQAVGSFHQQKERLLGALPFLARRSPII
jgi:hypothetical protein